MMIRMYGEMMFFVVTVRWMFLIIVLDVLGVKVIVIFVVRWVCWRC